jgi:hypothetical protein
MLHGLVADLLSLPYKFRLAELESEMGQHDGVSQSTPGLTQKRRAVGEVDKMEVLYSKELFETPEDATKRVTEESSPHFSRRLYEIISKESNSFGAFHLRPGTYQQVEKLLPQLELVKQACHIFALDEDVKNEVATMKRSLLKLLKVSKMYLCLP